MGGQESKPGDHAPAAGDSPETPDEANRANGSEAQNTDTVQNKADAKRTSEPEKASGDKDSSKQTEADSSDVVQVIGSDANVWTEQPKPESGPVFLKSAGPRPDRDKRANPEEAAVETLDDEVEGKSKSGITADGSVLLVGLVGSGKSTLKKQLHLILSQGYTEEEREEYRHVIRRYLIAQSLELVLDNWSYLNSLESGHRRPFTQYMQYCLDKEVKLRPNIPLCAHTRQALKELWRDERFLEMYRNNPVWRDSNLEEFAGRVDELADDGYKPSDLDIVKCFDSMQQHSTLLVSFSKPCKLNYEVSELRQPKAQHFSDCKALVFCVDISQVDTDHHKCCLKSAIIMFNSIVNHPNMECKPVFIFFVKKDLLEKRLPTLDMRRSFPELKSKKTPSVESLCKHIAGLFLARAPDKKIKHFFLNALTDVESTQKALQIAFVDICNAK